MAGILLGYCKNTTTKDIVSIEEKNHMLSDIEKVLDRHGLIVERFPNKNLDEHLWVRDNYFVLGNTCVLCNLTINDTIGKNRSIEEKDIENFLCERGCRTIRLPRHLLLEGGDIVSFGNHVFVGVGERTCLESVKFLKKRFPSYEFHSIAHSDLHLDCCFAALDDIIMYNDSKILEDMGTFREFFPDVDFINLDSIDASLFNTNFIEYNRTIFHGEISSAVKNIFLSKKYDVIELPSINTIYSEGGGIRCLTQWLPSKIG